MENKYIHIQIWERKSEISLKMKKAEAISTPGNGGYKSPNRNNIQVNLIPEKLMDEFNVIGPWKNQD